MNHARPLMVALLLLPALAACTPKPGANAAGPAPTLGSGPTVATVNGTTIGQDFYNFYVKRLTNGKTPADLTPEQRGEVLDDLIRQELVAQQAYGKEGLDADTQQLLTFAQMNVLSSVAAQKKVPKPTEQELREAYEKALTDQPKTEYHAKHILVATQPFAQKIIERLDKGEKFDDVAKAESMDTSSKTSGGDVGWFTPQNMEPGFADAVKTLSNGKYTHTPVQTRFGWHVIELLETRDAPPPPAFDNVKPRLEQYLEQKKIKEYTDDLLRSAKIEKKLDTSASAKPADAKASSAPASSSASK